MNSEMCPAGPEVQKSARKEKSIASAYIAQARQQYITSSLDLEIDGEPQVSFAENGAWVAAWVWVTQEDAGLSEKGPIRKASV
jgi:hypothetical protein